MQEEIKIRERKNIWYNIYKYVLVKQQLITDKYVLVKQRIIKFAWGNKYQAKSVIRSSHDQEVAGQGEVGHVHIKGVCDRICTSTVFL